LRELAASLRSPSPRVTAAASRVRLPPGEIASNHPFQRFDFGPDKCSRNALRLQDGIAEFSTTAEQKRISPLRHQLDSSDAIDASLSSRLRCVRSRELRFAGAGDGTDALGASGDKATAFAARR